MVSTGGRRGAARNGDTGRPGLHSPAMDTIETILAADPRISFALRFGSTARGHSHSHSDVDLGIGLVDGAELGRRELADLCSRLDSAAGGAVDLALMHEAPPGLAYRIFRDGVVILERDHRALAARKARAILKYLDFQPVEDLCARGVPARASDGR